MVYFGEKRVSAEEWHAAIPKRMHTLLYVFHILAYFQKLTLRMHTFEEKSLHTYS